MSQPEAKCPRLLLAPVYSASKRIGLHSSSAQTSPSARVTPAVTTAATAATSPDETQESQWCPFYLAYTVKFTEEYVHDLSELGELRLHVSGFPPTLRVLDSRKPPCRAGAGYISGF